MAEAPAENAPAERIDAIRTARYQRWVARLLMVLLVLQITMLFAVPRMGAAVGLSLIAAVIAGDALAVIAVVQILAAIKSRTTPLVICGCIAFLPFINLLLLTAVCLLAMGKLQDAGIRVGFFGTRNAEIEPLSRLLGCPGCGYSLFGNTSGRCPECGWEMPRAKKSATVASPIDDEGVEFGTKGGE